MNKFKNAKFRRLENKRMKQLMFSFLCSAIMVFGILRLRLAKENQCEMTYMHPGYEYVKVPGNDSPYGLVQYTGDREHSNKQRGGVKLHATAVVFVPGHKGDVLQVRSLGAHVRRLGLPLEVYGLDVLSEPSALHAGLLWQQARFAALAVRHVASLHTSAPNVLMVGHSLGGLVIRTALILPSFPVGRVTTVITLGTPHAAPPLHLDRSLSTFYHQLNSRFWRTSLPTPPPPPPRPPPLPEVETVSGAHGTSDEGGGGAWAWVSGLFANSNSSSEGNETTNTSIAAEGAEAATEAADNNCSTSDDTCTAAAAAVDEPETSLPGRSSPRPSAPSASGAEQGGGSVSGGEWSEGGTLAGQAAEALSEAAAAARAGVSARQRRAAVAEKARSHRTQRLAFANARLGNVTLVSLSGGDSHDLVVPTSLTSLQGLAPPGQSWSASVADPELGESSLLGFGVDHLALVWCFQLQDALARALGAVAALDLTAYTSAANPKGGPSAGGASSTGFGSVPLGALPALRLEAIKTEFRRDSSSSSSSSSDSESGWWLASFFGDLATAFNGFALELVSYRSAVASSVSLWTLVGLLSLASALSHALVDAADPPATLPPPASLVGSAGLHWPCLLVIAPAARGAKASVLNLPKWAHFAAAASVAGFVLLSAVDYYGLDVDSLAVGSWFQSSDDSGGATTDTAAAAAAAAAASEALLEETAEGAAAPTAELSWFTAFASTASAFAYAALGSLLSLVRTHALELLRSTAVASLRALAAPAQFACHLTLFFATACAGPCVVYGSLLVVVGLAAELLAALQHACGLVAAHRTVAAAVATLASCLALAATPFTAAVSAATKAAMKAGSCAGAAWGAFRTVLGYFPVVGKWVGNPTPSSEDPKSGDDLREDFRNRRAAKGGSGTSMPSKSQGGSLVSRLLSPKEQKLGLALLFAWGALHLKWVPGNTNKEEGEEGGSGANEHAAAAAASTAGRFFLRGLLSPDHSFAQELAVATTFAVSACVALLLSFLLLPAPAQDPELRKYHLLLCVAYAPLLPLGFGSLTHAWTVLLSRPATAAGLAYSSAANLTFDGVCDCGLFLCCAGHLFFARFRTLPLPKPLHGSDALWEELEVEQGAASPAPNKGSSSSSAWVVRRPLDYSQLPTAPLLAKLLPVKAGRAWAAGTPDKVENSSNGGAAADSTDLVVVAGEGGGESVVWLRRYNWRTGLTFYEKRGTGELRYPEGGPKALFEETILDSEGPERELAPGVTLGPGFVVVAEGKLGSGSAEAFTELWGHSFARTTTERSTGMASGRQRFNSRGGGGGGGVAGGVAERVMSEALECADFYLVLALYVLAAFVAAAGVMAGLTYHSLTALGIVAGAFTCRHVTHTAAPS